MGASARPCALSGHHLPVSAATASAGAGTCMGIAQSGAGSCKSHPLSLNSHFPRKEKGPSGGLHRHYSGSGVAWGSSGAPLEEDRSLGCLQKQEQFASVSWALPVPASSRLYSSWPVAARKAGPAAAEADCSSPSADFPAGGLAHNRCPVTPMPAGCVWVRRLHCHSWRAAPSLAWDWSCLPMEHLLGAVLCWVHSVCTPSL